MRLIVKRFREKKEKRKGRRRRFTDGRPGAARSTRSHGARFSRVTRRGERGGREGEEGGGRREREKKISFRKEGGRDGERPFLRRPPSVHKWLRSHPKMAAAWRKATWHSERVSQERAIDI